MIGVDHKTIAKTDTGRPQSMQNNRGWIPTKTEEQKPGLTMWVDHHNKCKTKTGADFNKKTKS